MDSTPGEMLGLIRHVAFPQALAACWEMEAFDSDDRPLSLEEVISAAEGDKASEADVRIARKLAARIDAALTMDGTALQRELGLIAKAFTKQFGKGHWSDVTIAYYPNLIAAANAHFKQRSDEGALEVDGEEYSRREWLDVLSRAATNLEARRIVRKAFEQDEF